MNDDLDSTRSARRRASIVASAIALGGLAVATLVWAAPVTLNVGSLHVQSRSVGSLYEPIGSAPYAGCVATWTTDTRGDYRVFDSWSCPSTTTSTTTTTSSSTTSTTLPPA